MYLPAQPADIKQAKAPHELFMINLLLFHLLMTPAAIVLGIGLWGLLLPLLLSLSVIAYSGWRSRRAEQGHRLVMLHWKLALRHYRILLFGYLVTVAILSLGLLLTLAMDEGSMRHIVLTVVTRIAVVPLVVMVFILAFLESSALSQAAGQEVPEGLYSRYFADIPAPGEDNNG